MTTKLAQSLEVLQKRAMNIIFSRQNIMHHIIVNMVRDLGTLIDTDVPMKSHVVKATAACFTVLLRHRSIRRLVSDPVLRLLASCLVLSMLDHGNAVLAGISVHPIKRLHPVLNSAARLFSSSSKFNYVTPLLRQLHWLRAPCRVNFELAVIAFKCIHGPTTDELYNPAETEFRQRFRSASSPALSVRVGR